MGYRIEYDHTRIRRTEFREIASNIGFIRLTAILFASAVVFSLIGLTLGYYLHGQGYHFFREKTLSGYMQVVDSSFRSPHLINGQ